MDNSFYRQSIQLVQWQVHLVNWLQFFRCFPCFDVLFIVVDNFDFISLFYVFMRFSFNATNWVTFHDNLLNFILLDSVWLKEFNHSSISYIYLHREEWNRNSRDSGDSAGRGWMQGINVLRWVIYISGWKIFIIFWSKTISNMKPTELLWRCDSEVNDEFI